MKVTCCDFIDAIRTAIVIFLVTSALATIYLSRQAYYEEVCRLTHGLNAYREFRLDIDRSIRPNWTQIKGGTAKSRVPRYPWWEKNPY